MRDVELYRQLLGLESPWTVGRVELSVAEKQVTVWVEHRRPRSWPCPECGAACGLHDHDEERSWRHLDSCQFETHVRARVPRVRCSEHGVRVVRVPWAEPRSRFTLLFERFAIDVLLETDVAGASKILGISWDEAHHLMRRAVSRGLLRRRKTVPKYLGVDEKSIAKGHRYATLVTDLERGTVVEVAEDRKMTSLMMCLGGFTMKELSQVDAVAMDMWEPYVQTLRILMPGAGEKIVFDRFHIVGHMNEAVDLVRRRENRSLRVDGDERLVGSKHWWLYGAENLPGRYEELFSSLRKANLKTARAWAIKELLRSLWKRPSEETGRRWWRRWYSWATRCRLTPVRNVAAMLKRHLPNVLSYFRHRVTNSTSEALNSVIQMIKKRAFGFRNFDNFRTSVLFRCGGLDLYPQTHPKVG